MAPWVWGVFSAARSAFVGGLPLQHRKDATQLQRRIHVQRRDLAAAHHGKRHPHGDGATHSPPENREPGPIWTKNMLLRIVPQGCTKPRLWLRRKHEGTSGPKAPSRALRAWRVGPGPWIPTVNEQGTRSRRATRNLDVSLEPKVARVTQDALPKHSLPPMLLERLATSCSPVRSLARATCLQHRGESRRYAFKGGPSRVRRSRERGFA